MFSAPLNPPKELKTTEKEKPVSIPKHQEN
jgi:hypothetical protein